MNFKKWFRENFETAYQGRRKAFRGTDYNLGLLAKYEPANLGLFFTNSVEIATEFSRGNYVDKVRIDTKNFEIKDAKGENLRNFVPWIKKAKKNKKDGVILTNVIDGKKHNKLFIVFNPKVVAERSEL